MPHALKLRVLSSILALERMFLFLWRSTLVRKYSEALQRTSHLGKRHQTGFVVLSLMRISS